MDRDKKQSYNKNQIKPEVSKEQKYLPVAAKGQGMKKYRKIISEQTNGLTVTVQLSRGM